MQEVSQGWKDNQKENFVSESFLEISYEISDPTAQEDSYATDNGEAFYSNASQIVRKTEKKPKRYATLERNFWALDKTFDILGHDYQNEENGYIGNLLSDENGNFSIFPTITISFNAIHKSLIPGITITWATAYAEFDEWADTIRVTAFLNEEVRAQKNINGNDSITTIASLDIENYNKIIIEILKWNKPYRRARIKNILIGIEKIYTKADLMDFKHTISIDPLSATLPKTEIKFGIINIDNAYNPDNPTGAEKYLMKRQEIKFRYGYKINGSIEWIQGGILYTSEWDTPQNGITASFTAKSLLEFMNSIYTGSVEGSLYEIAEQAFLQSHLPLNLDGSVKWKLSDSLRTILAPKEADLSNYTIAEVLQLIANASCSVLYQGRDGILRIEPLEKTETDYRIDQNNSYDNSDISLTKQIKSIDINGKNQIDEVDTEGENQSIINPLISDDQAKNVAMWAKEYLQNRRILSGEWRADPRIDALDIITVQNQFSESNMITTEVEFSYNGAFRGLYEGRAI